MTITSVSLSAGDYGGIVVTALKKVSSAHAPVVINSPHTPETPTSEGGPELPSYVRTLIGTLEDEAQKFWSGERAQQELFTDA